MNKGGPQVDEVEIERMIARDHPALAGHFPGEPLVPGVVVLECVVAAAEEEFGPHRLIAIPSIKFLAPLHPGERFQISLRRRDGAGIAFECRRHSTILAKGRLVRER